MFIFRRAVLCFFVSLLAACGGGGSSDGGGSANGFDVAELPKFAGTYEGTVTATVNANGENQTLSRPIRFVVAEGGESIRVDSETFPLTSNVFEVEVPLPLSNKNVTCILNGTFNGTITFEQISGTVNGSGDCLVEGSGVVTGELSGYSGASRI